MIEIDERALRLSEGHFHALIHERAGRLLDEQEVALPDLKESLRSAEVKSWLPVPGMYGGFSYWFDRLGENPRLITESWCRVVGGSGQRHEVTVKGIRLLEQGFV